MKLNSRQIVALCTILVLTLTLAACGQAANPSNKNQQPPPSSQASQDAEKSEDQAAKPPSTRKVNTVMGEVEVPAEPKRVVAQGYLAAVLALGVKPVGAPYWDIESPHNRHLTEGMGIEDTGHIDLSSVEKILSLDPDLIITLSDDPAIYEQLSLIAPTVVFPYNTLGEARNEVRTIGQVLGREKEAEEWIDSFNITVAKAKERLKGIMKEDETVSLMGGHNKALYVYAGDSWRGAQAIYDHLELKRPPLVQEMHNQNVGSSVISLEKVPDFMGDYLFVEAGQSGSFDPSEDLWKHLSPVKNNQVFTLKSEYFWPFDPLAVKAQVDLVADMIIERHKENQANTK
ncbi:ABC transporter substrate-binding protein [Paenibacillus paeoniae]|uniref:Fe3+-citrate ABC transporter substrate-binding protein n=1 Tax=Paenibacillus paeoniae TaxID=2292705 RepID=A0A371P5T4_9BACL|nr:ABC transporter substrate-binding protein [Paenibacillus paeoniae]REK71225.1 Fe3+-citrate ABC transporter substrate-binding protein [Paenibacillus paeoniae]